MSSAHTEKKDEDCEVRGGERVKTVERDKEVVISATALLAPQLSVSLECHHQPIERLLGWIEHTLSSIWGAVLLDQSFCWLHSSPEGKDIFSKIPSNEKRKNNGK